MSKRNDVLALLHVAGQSGATCNITADLLAELCEAWLALDAAPVAKVPRGKVGSLLFLPVSHDFAGQRVRLVAASGGDREDR